MQEKQLRQQEEKRLRQKLAAEGLGIGPQQLELQVKAWGHIHAL